MVRELVKFSKIVRNHRFLVISIDFLWFSLIFARFLWKIHDFLLNHDFKVLCRLAQFGNVSTRGGCTLELILTNNYWFFHKKMKKIRKNMKNLCLGVGTWGPHRTSKSSKISKFHEIQGFEAPYFFFRFFLSRKDI